MRIAHIDLYRASIPFHEPFRYALTETTATHNVFVRITADNGATGWGEASPTQPITGDTQDLVVAALHEYGRLLAGREVSDPVGAADAMAALLVFNTTARSALDMALYDLAARAAGKPLYAFLGGERRPFQTDNTLGISSPEDMAEKALRFLAQGFRAIKVKLGTGLEDDVARVRTIREAVGDGIPIRIDANQGWSVETAIAVLAAVADLDVQYCEQPVHFRDRQGMARVRQASSIPIMADEAVFDHRDAAELVAMEACDYFNIKLAKSSGIVNALRIAAVAEAHGLACMVGCMSETRLGLSAAAHVISARPVIRFADLDSHVDHRIDPVMGGMRIEDGTVIVPDKPGHGADLDPEFLASCEAIRVV